MLERSVVGMLTFLIPHSVVYRNHVKHVCLWVLNAPFFNPRKNGVQLDSKFTRIMLYSLVELLHSLTTSLVVYRRSGSNKPMC